jgi:hypothetical protein
MPKFSVKIVFAELLSTPTSSAIFQVVKQQSSMIDIQTLSMTSAFWLVHGLLERWSLSADMLPSLKWLNHSLIRVTLIASSPEAC